MSTSLDIIYMTKQANSATETQRDRPANALAEAEAVIARWDQESGLTYRELAIKLSNIFTQDERPKISL